MSGSPFLAYDIRGRVGDQLDEEIVEKIGRAFVTLISPRTVVVGRDIRASSARLSEALVAGLTDAGADVLDIGLCGTEMVYFATSFLFAQGGIMITASHNPADYNGMKMVREGSVPISRDNGLHDIRDMIESVVPGSDVKGRYREVDIWDDYISKVLGFIGDRGSLQGFRIVTDPGHGCAGPAVDRIAEALDLDIVRKHHEPDGTFPAGIPNPLLPEMRDPTSETVKASGADIGVAWDGDFDRCFLFDEKGEFVEGYYMVGILAKMMLRRDKGAKIIHDPRLVWNTIEEVRDGGGIPVMNRTGHAFIKDRMRSEDAVYGGEMSAHHYFRDFYYCDTGMVPWLLVLELMASEGKPLSEMVGERMRRYPVSGEINKSVKDPTAVISEVERIYSRGAVSVDHTDGVSIEAENYRFNLRASNTEPLIRLNVETRGDRELLERITAEVLDSIDGIDSAS